MNFDEYKAIQGVNWTSLKHLRESPLRYRYMQSAQDDDTTARAIGRAAHALVFEPEVFLKDFAIYLGGDRRGKAWDEFKAMHSGRTILKASEVENAVAMSDAVRANPLVAPYLESGIFEQTVTWTDPDTKLGCKARLDFINPEMGALIDLKTTTTIDAYRFGRIAARLGYHCQMSHYRDGVEYGMGWLPKETLIVAVESSPPYDVAVFVLSEDDLWAGREEVLELLHKLKIHRASDSWPGRYPVKTPLLMPPYVFGDDDEDTAGLGVNFGKGE